MGEISKEAMSGEEVAKAFVQHFYGKFTAGGAQVGGVFIVVCFGVLTSRDCCNITQILRRGCPLEAFLAVIIVFKALFRFFCSEHVSSKRSGEGCRRACLHL